LLHKYDTLHLNIQHFQKTSLTNVIIIIKK